MITTLINIAIFWITFIIGVLFSHYFIKYITPHIKPFSPFDCYPFICDKCLSTWTLISLYVMIGLLINSILFIILGVILSGLYGFGKYKLEKERMEDEIERETNNLYEELKKKVIFSKKNNKEIY